MNASKHLVLPVSSIDDAVKLLPFATAIARGWRERVLLVGIVSVPHEESLSLGTVTAQELRAGFARLAGADPLVDTAPTTLVTHDAWAEIVQEVEGAGADLLLLQWPDEGQIFGRDLSEVLGSPPCDIALIRPGPSPVRSVLLPIRGGPHAELALSVSTALAETFGGEITALHAAHPAPSASADGLFVDLVPALEQLPPVTRVLTVRRPILGAILAEAQHHDCIVMGAAARPVQGVEAVGAVTARVFRQTEGTVIAVKTRREVVYPEAAPDATAEGSIETPTGTELVDKWFAQSTFHSREFADLECLLEMKRAQGLTISLGLPALNEERTVGRVISTLKGALMDDLPLLDEVVLIDSNSADHTRDIAADLGVPVHIHQQILPDYGAYRGKGEALWKSLYVLTGDIIVWVDTDIVNIGPHFVYGLLGPLLRCEQVQYVKGFYRRPLHVGDQLQAGAGGRVTELVARPMLNLFYPVLSGMVQPLSGEYAGRRSALERVPFFTGYGVETGLLIDMLNVFGLDAIAQSDLEERIHKNQELAALGKMSFQILQVFVRRLEQRRGPLPAEINKTMKLVQQTQEGFYLDMEDIEEHERPPMITLPEYQSVRGLNLMAWV